MAVKVSEYTQKQSEKHEEERNQKLEKQPIPQKAKKQKANFLLPAPQKESSPIKSDVPKNPLNKRQEDEAKTPSLSSESDSDDSPNK